ncbi:hypothetical protein UCDDA912_g04471 [Diaporthe ampelina]|uniref:Uncharacterized protein n=1 Tax=Diaporthe ampelina TaxID=1214573 RepID=A0A0G2I6N5_9PEZI|nr:hypothetical protein UCDDA912_g04471 [Diaporthe ampelina]
MSSPLFLNEKAIVAQPTPPLPPPTPNSNTPDQTPNIATRDEQQRLPAALRAPVKIPQPLITDVSLYTNSYLAPVDAAESTSLDELAHLVRLSKYQERKRANTRIRLQRTLVSTALSARLTRCGEIAQRNLAECFRTDDKKTFAALYGAVQDVRKSCDEVRRYALLEPEVELLQSPGMVSSESLETPTGSVVAAGPMAGSTVPFLHDISADARETFLSFLSKIRNDPDYLATRICSLSNSERAAITNFHSGLDPVESVLPLYNKPHVRGPGTSSRHLSNNPSPVERLLSFQRHDALSALIYTCFANSAGPDSAEDKRRTDVWANACARLISKSASESKSGNENVPIEPVLIHVLNVWSNMRDWAGRSNMEWYLMKILEDGAFLLDRAEDQHGTRFNISDWTSKDQIAADEFYDRATDELFDILDDQDATGIPEGLLEIGNQILRRLDHKYVDSTRKWFVYKWLFSVWLLGVVVHPESHGMMTDYHITEYGRQKILKQVAMRASSVVVDMLWKTGPVSTPPKVKAHVENMLGRFKNSRYKPRSRLLRARSITSLRETAEVHPYLVVSPADLVTLVNALFPEKRPMSSASIRSGAPSISGMSTISQPMSMATSRSNNNFETASIISTSVSSVLSDTSTAAETTIEPQATGTSARSSPPLGARPSQEYMSNYEDDGYRLRLALHEMTQILGVDTSCGSCHPCAERWAVLFISSDGKSLSTQMTYDPDDEPEEENSSSLSETDEDDLDDDRPELDKDYHQLRDSILKLVEDFEIPPTSEHETGKFSNRTSTLKKYRSKNKIITTEKARPGSPSRNPYRRKVTGQDSPIRTGSPLAGGDKGKEAAGRGQEQSEPTPVLVAMLQAAASQARAQSDFVGSLSYFRTLQQLNALSSSSLRADGFATLLNIFSRGPRDSIRRSASAIEEYDAWLVWLKQSQERAEGLIESMMRRLRALRDKMCRSRSMPRGAATTYIYRNESQIIDLLAATEDQGGPNKLSDDQAEKTSRFLEEYGIENFCRGEERIHRFCCEVKACIGKLVGDNIMDGPVLWSSELYLRDKKLLEAPPQRLNDDKTRFLTDLRQTLTSLLLSDLGNLVFSTGSETDGWFEDLGQDCIDRRDANERKAKKRRSRLRVIARKESFGNLRDANNAADAAALNQSTSESQSAAGAQPNRDNESSATSDTLSSKKASKSSRENLAEFPFTGAYQRLLRMFCVHPNPYAKLNALFELEHLIVASLTSGSPRRRLAWLRSAELEAEKYNQGGHCRPFEEAIDNLRERRSLTLQTPGLGSNRMPGGNLNSETRSVVNMSSTASNTDAVATVLQSLFRNAEIRPATLFRDLQFIASFVPASILDKTDRGKAFWDCAIAALGLKQEVCRTMVEMADELVGVYTKTRRGNPPPPESTASSSINGEDEARTQRPSPSAEQQASRTASTSPPTPPPPSTTYRLEDAARMWTITAKEGDPTSQRELALFYLSNPELVDRTTLPLSKPREVFKHAVMEKYGGGNGARVGAGQPHRPGSAGHGLGMDGGRRDVRSDGALMCVAIHWMEAAEQGGDELARTFLGQNDLGL